MGLHNKVGPRLMLGECISHLLCVVNGPLTQKDTLLPLTKVFGQHIYTMYLCHRHSTQYGECAFAESGVLLNEQPHHGNTASEIERCERVFGEINMSARESSLKIPIINRNFTDGVTK